ncbi:hypothetical protein DZC31_24705 [Stenotrophomonas rhizophila]|nr:hypothetical protein DZC31_24705 [Stenotrophomonas rhizophila]
MRAVAGLGPAGEPYRQDSLIQPATACSRARPLPQGSALPCGSGRAREQAGIGDTRLSRTTDTPPSPPLH